MKRLLPLLILIGCGVATVAGYFFYRNACLRLEHVAQEHLVSLCKTKKELIEKYFKKIQEEIVALARKEETAQATEAFKNAYLLLDKNSDKDKIERQKAVLYLYYQDQFIRKLNFQLREKKLIEDFFPQNPAGILLQSIYIAENPNPVGKKLNLVSAPDAGEYNIVHITYHPIFLEILKKYSYYDMFLIDTKDGTIYYTVFKEVDFANNLFKTGLRSTNFAYLIATAAEISEPKIADFSFYPPSYAAPAAFIAMPIHKNNGIVGILAFQLPINKINAIMTNSEHWQEEGLGSTGEAYLVGKDKMMRSISRELAENKLLFIDKLQKRGVDPQLLYNMREFETTILLQAVESDSVFAALKGESGVTKTLNYVGEPVLSAYEPINISGLEWALIVEQSLQEICLPVHRLYMRIIYCLVLLMLSAFFAYFLYRYIKKRRAYKK